MAAVSASPLGRLIERVVDDSFDGVQDRLARAMKVSPQTISRYKVEYPLKSIVPSFLVALSKASKVELTAVVRAALASARLPDAYEPPATLAEAVSLDPGLSSEHKRMILALVAEAQRGRRGHLRPVRQEAAYEPPQPPGPVEE